MGPLQKAIDDVKYSIPRRILETVFVPKTTSWRQAPISLDEAIMMAVVRPQVLVDCNLVGGTEAWINLSGVEYDKPDQFTSVFRIPKEITHGRSILSVLNITFTDPTRASTYGVSSTQDVSTMMLAGQGVMDSMGSAPVISTAKVQLIGENTVMVRDTTLLPGMLYLRCILMNDENMSHIQPRSYHAFSKLVDYAVKAYIYNDHIIQMDMGELHGGQALGIFKEIVMEYRDARELYQTYLREVWTKVAFMNDNETMTRHLRMMVGAMR